MTEDIGLARVDELDELARTWHESWHFAHDDIVDPELVAARTPELFRERIEKHLHGTICARFDNKPVGLAIIKGEELYQFFLAEQARGTGVAYRLMHMALDRFAGADVDQPHLCVADCNEHAIGFYKRTGWMVDKRGIENISVDGRTFGLPVFIMVRPL